MNLSSFKLKERPRVKSALKKQLWLKAINVKKATLSQERRKNVSGVRIPIVKVSQYSSDSRTMFRMPVIVNVVVRYVTGNNVLVPSPLGKSNKPTLRAITLI